MDDTQNIVPAIATNDTVFTGPITVPDQQVLKSFITKVAPTTTVIAGQASHTLGSASGSQTIAHGLGRTPRFLRITGSTLQGTTISSSVGTYDGTTMYFVSVTSGAPNWGSGAIVSFTDGAGNTCVATVTLDSTNINLTWTKGGTGGTGDFHYIWEVIG